MTTIAKVLAVAAAMATFVWMPEYSLPRSAELPTHHWWFSDITRFLNSFCTSFLDYTFGILGLVFAVTRDPSVMTKVADIVSVPIQSKRAIDAALPLDAWRFWQWDNRLANWLGHFAFALLLAWAMLSIVRSGMPRWAKVSTVAIMSLPFAGVFVGQQLMVG